MTNETTFTFKKTKYFFPMINKMFDLDIDDINKDYSTEGNYALVLCSAIPSDMTDVIDSNGCLNRDATGLEVLDIQDEYTDFETPYFNLEVTPIDDYAGGFTIAIDTTNSNDVQVQIGDATQYLQGAFLVRRSNDFIMCYSRIQSPIAINNFITLPFDSKLISVAYSTTQIY